MERLNTFYSKRKDLQYDIEKEMEEYPSEKVSECRIQNFDPLNQLMHTDAKGDEIVEENLNKTKTNESVVIFYQF